MEKTDEALAKELQDAVNRLNQLINDAELSDIIVEVRQVNSYTITIGQKPTSFLTLKVSKSLLEPVPVYYTGSY